MSGSEESAEEPQQAEYEFYVYEDGEPRYSFWIYHGDRGMCLYDRPPEGHGMWLKPDRNSDYDSTKPSEELQKIVATLVAREDGVPTDLVMQLEPHERHFVQVIHGTVDENPDAVPDSVWAWMWDCHEELGVVES